MGRKKKTELDLMRDALFRKRLRQRQALEGPFLCPKCGIDPKIKSLYMREFNHNQSFLLPPKGLTLSEWVRQQEAYEKYQKACDAWLENPEEGNRPEAVPEPKKGVLRQAEIRTIKFYCDNSAEGCDFVHIEKYGKVVTDMEVLREMAPEIIWIDPAVGEAPAGIDRYNAAFDSNLAVEDHDALVQVLLRPQEDVKVVKFVEPVQVRMVEPPKPKKEKKVKAPKPKRVRIPKKEINARIEKLLKEMRK